ncbi:gamma tubulin complex Spc97/GCP2 subunit Alp4 [Yamadazyma tenuis]|uniref:Spindle pole body component n=1 Tax=Candida tenuis (strain ATCC 10573 / BCRC 21748 / CBS 615 / JCM 9827 / NBRC 10315 / NRRL Y-1498 / VKM Y-70) TaxID=590646 RepID=G3B862_CANTC|nr:uncharacterized protein CANTEDRAFT_95247 [Yamadazyma tenuis ATCC 10573]EGV62359.1 hypothetical protein CANTEDRAFT_95247 [Yamadazyma tenuis ATCC 10573]WEJ93625.1 gamma tubulin complex Spc97/GCP2 subunit Alp4 [Yamadazyma tenuis]
MDTPIDTVTLSNEPRLLQTCVIHDLRFQKARYHGLRDLTDINVQQALITKDLLFTLLGHEGQFIRLSDKYSARDLEVSIGGPEFKIAKNLDISLKLVTKKIIKFGRYYCSINNFLEHYDNESFGKAVQNLCHAIVAFKDKYEKVVIELENSFKYDASFNLNWFDNILNKQISSEMGHFYEIVNMIHNETLKRQREYFHNRDKYLDEYAQTQIGDDFHNPGSVDLFVDPIKFNVCKGGLVLQAIQQRIRAFKGDVVSTTFLTKLFEEVSKDYLNSLNEWLVNGIIDDPFKEFLIKQTSFQSFLKPSMQIYWDEIFKFRYDGLIDQLQSKDIQNKILLTGKYLNIFKHCTGLENFESFNENLMPIKSIFSQDFELKVDNFYKRANKLLMKLIFEGYNFNFVVEYYSKQFLLDNSSGVDNFIEANLNDLQRNKFKISISKLIKSFNNTLLSDENNDLSPLNKSLNSKLEFSINSLSFYDLAKEVLAVEPINAEDAIRDINRGETFEEIVHKNLDNKRQNIASAGSNISPESTGNFRYDPQNADQLTILGVNLSMDLQFPLNLVINYNFNLQYQLVFNNQLFLKFINKLIDNTWKEVSLSHVWNFPGFDRKISKWILRSRVLLNRMRDFVNELHYYISLEVIDKNHKELKSHLESVAHQLKEEPLESSFSEADASGFNGNSSFVKGMTNSYHELFNSKANNTNASPVDIIDLNNLSSKMATILNNILRDTFLVHEKVMNELQELLVLIVSYNQFLNKLKSSLIMMNDELFFQYKEAYPVYMEDKEINSNSVETIYGNLNDELIKYFEGFNNSLTRFMSSINSNLDNSSQQFLNLFQSLENCFPDQ